MIRHPRTLLALASVAGVAAAGFLRVFRPWHLRWGAADAEVRRRLPGDEVVTEPTFEATRAVTVEAPSGAVWPWIAQIGFGRAGWYSYDLLDNLGRHSAERVIPALQEVRVGDPVPMGPGGAGLWVKDFVPEEWMLWWDGSGYTTWLWHLERVSAHRTRMITRVRMRYRWTHPSIAFALLLIEPFDVVGIFPDDASLIRLATSLVIEQNDEWLVGRRYLSLDSLAPLLEERRDQDVDEEVPALTAA